MTKEEVKRISMWFRLRFFSAFQTKIKYLLKKKRLKKRIKSKCYLFYKKPKLMTFTLHSKTKLVILEYLLKGILKITEVLKSKH